MKLTPAKVTMMMLMAVAGLVGLYIVKGLFAVQKPPTRPAIVNIPLAAAHLKPGTKITRDHIGMGPYPERELKEDMLRSERVIVGRVVKEEIKPGSPLRGTQLYEPGENAPLLVSEGKQAVSVSVKNSADMVDGLIKPGDFVDVHFTLDTQSAGSIDARINRLGGVSMTLFKGVKVLALNKNFRQGPVLASGNSVTLELAPAQVNVLLVVQSRGAISLAQNPNGEGDGGVALSNADRATLWEVLGLKKPVAKAPEPRREPEKPFVMETYRGTRGGSLEWDKNGKKFDAAAAARAANNGTGYDYGSSRARDWPAGSGGAGAGAGGVNGTYWGSGSYADPYDYNRGASSGRDAAGDDFDPDDVFVSPGGAANQSVDEPAAGPAEPVQQDPDIPVTEDVPARGVRSRVGSILRARPRTSGPTALRN